MTFDEIVKRDAFPRACTIERLGKLCGEIAKADWAFSHTEIHPTGTRRQIDDLRKAIRCARQDLKDLDKDLVELIQALKKETE